jgi:hypothetical protein
MSKKKERAWFVCRTWPDIVSRHYATDQDTARALNLDPKLLAKLRAGTPVAKSSLLRTPRHFATRHELATPLADLVVDTRPHRAESDPHESLSSRHDQARPGQLSRHFAGTDGRSSP